jgi:recombination DNA repair RAD52 pathway protein
MGRFLAIFLLSLAHDSLVAVRAQAPVGVAPFLATLQTACQTHDPALVKSCYDLDGVSPSEGDRALDGWRQYWNEQGTTNWVFTKIEYKTLQEARTEKTTPEIAFLRARAAAKMAELRRASHQKSQFNLEVTGYVEITYTNDPNHTVTTCTYPVGAMPNGTFKIVMTHPVE